MFGRLIHLSMRWILNHGPGSGAPTASEQIGPKGEGHGVEKRT
jgi:hypothetical protein